MKLERMKTASQVKLPGINIEFVTEDRTLTEIILRPEGSEASYSVRNGGGYSSSLVIFSRCLYDTKEVFRLAGTYQGLRVSEDFDEETEALDKLSRLVSEDPKAKLTVEKVKARVDEAGEVVASSDIPF